MARTASLTWGEYRDLWQNWSRRYLCRSGAWKIDGRPVCAFNNLGDFVARYGQATFAVMLRYGARVAEREIGVAPYLLGVIGVANLHNVRLTNALPVDGITGYGLLPNWRGAPTQDYEFLIRQRVANWDDIQGKICVPFYPVVCAGWDATVRGSFRGELCSEDGYPYSPVVTGVTPELFGQFLDHAIAFNRRWQPREQIVFLHAWNEWSESSVLEPNDQFDTAFLDEIRKRSEAFDVQPDLVTSDTTLDLAR